MEMLRNLHKFIEKENLFGPNHKLLLAISGGMDSMVMLHLIRQLDNPAGVVHVNHMLRGMQSDLDQEFVENYCRDLSIPCYTTQFRISKTKKKSGGNIQNLARKQRYRFFEEIRKKHSFDYILTAHHLDDLIETFFLNLLRGSGLKGLSGIPVRSEKIRRPLMDCYRSEIANYAKQQNINYRDDPSNQEIKYDRNRIRHHLIPLIINLKPAARETIVRSIRNLKNELEFREFCLENVIRDVTITKDGQIWIDKAQIANIPGNFGILFYMLGPYGFHRSQVRDLMSNWGHIGIEFLASNYKIINDRKYIFVIPVNTTGDFTSFTIHSQGNYHLPGDRVLSIRNASGILDQDDSFTEYIDAGKISFPLEVRPWRKGDRFRPLGMKKGTQKIKDFLTNIKIPKHEKKSVWVLESKDRIVWVIGYRLDDRFKVSEDSDRLFRLQIIRTGTTEN